MVDLGSLDTVEEQRLIAETVLSTLWRNRSRREPCLVVIDEAHNVCPSKPGDAVTALATNHAALIAAEGRKFGLYLLTSTQRPQKVNEEVLSQCDNLLLMRMNSEADLGYLSDIFSFVPPSLIQRATTVRARRDPGRRQVLPPRRLREVRGPDVAGGRRRHPHRLGEPRHEPIVIAMDVDCDPGQTACDEYPGS